MKFRPSEPGVVISAVGHAALLAATLVVFSDAPKFKEAEEKLFAEMPKIVAAARGGKQDELRAAFAAGGGVCKNCHDNFRQ